MEGQLVATIQENLALYLNENAIFLAERLLAEFPSEQNVYLLATCYHRAQQSYRAYHLLKGELNQSGDDERSDLFFYIKDLYLTFLSHHVMAGLHGPQCRYLFALCCLEMGKLTEAESALLPDNDVSRVPNGAAGYFLLGRCFQLSNRHSVAVAYYNTALKLDRMMWCAYEQLCILGADSEAQDYINTHQQGNNNNAHTPAATTPQQSQSGAQTQAQPSTAGFTFTFATHTPPGQVVEQLGRGLGTIGQTPVLGVKNGGRQTLIDRQTADWGVSAMEDAPSAEDFTTPDAAELPSGPPPIPRGAAWPPSAAVPGGGGASPSVLSGWQQDGDSSMAQERKFLDDGKLRKYSSKLFSDPASALRMVGAPSTILPGHGVTPAQVHAEDAAAMVQLAAVPGIPRGERTLEGQAAAVGLLQQFGEAFRLLSMYKCQEAIDAFSRLPQNHVQTGWVLIQLGRAFFEMVNYSSAAVAFEQARKIDPFRLKGIEVYSTVLWHMKREVELSALSQEVVAIDRQSPAAWCVMGNCFSLQKEHESALRFFQRALQLDSTLPYAYTLCGHEYFANEDFEKGITCYRNAIRIDPRHYNAWFGMGHIYYRQEKFGMAEYHFRRAHVINDRSSVLRCYLGMSLHKLKRSAEALQVLSEAIVADKNNPLARFERAGVLASDGRLEEALSELQALHNLVPREASVLFHMGKVFKRLGRTQDALAAFSEALDLQPPSADTNVIKSAIDRVTQPDAEEEEEV